MSKLLEVTGIETISLAPDNRCQGERRQRLQAESHDWADSLNMKCVAVKERGGGEELEGVAVRIADGIGWGKMQVFVTVDPDEVEVSKLSQIGSYKGFYLWREDNYWTHIVSWGDRFLIRLLDEEPSSKLSVRAGVGGPYYIPRRD